MKRRLAIALVGLFLSLTVHASGPTNALAKLHGVHRVLFLGDSITYAGHYIEDIEAYYASRFPDLHFEFLNLGLSSETVSGLSEPGHAGGKYARPDVHERLGRILAKTKPDIIFACYGMNDGIYEAYSEERFRKFQDGMKWLHEQTTAVARTIHVTPPVFDPQPIKTRVSTNGNGGFSHPYGGYNEVLDRYSDWLLGQRAGGWDVVDLHGAMNLWLAAERARDAGFNFTADGVHPDAAGHWIMAKQILLHLGAADAREAGSPAAMLPPGSEKLLNLIRQKQQTLRDAWLGETGHTRPGVKPGLPLAEAEAKAADLDKQIHEMAAHRP